MPRDVTDAQAVMIIDDDPDILEVVEEVLRDDGYRVAAFPDGARALSYAREHVPALVLTDLLIPPMGGRELIARLRALHGERLPIVVMSAFTDRAARLAGVRVEGILRKPFELEDLASLVRRWAPPDADAAG